MKAKMFRAYRTHNMAPAYHIPHLYLTMGLPLIPQHQSPFFGVLCLIFPDYMSSLYKFPHYLVIWKRSKLYNYLFDGIRKCAYLIYHYIPSTKPYMQWCETVKDRIFYCGSLKPWFRLLILNLLLNLLLTQFPHLKMGIMMDFRVRMWIRIVPDIH